MPFFYLTSCNHFFYLTKFFYKDSVLFYSIIILNSNKDENYFTNYKNLDYYYNCG